MRSWDDLIRNPAPAYKLVCIECNHKIVGNNYRKLQKTMREHTTEKHNNASH